VTSGVAGETVAGSATCPAGHVTVLEAAAGDGLELGVADAAVLQ
jgi:hypothetical protein